VELSAGISAATKKEEGVSSRSQIIEDRIDVFDPHEYMFDNLKPTEISSSSSALAIISESSFLSSSFTSTTQARPLENENCFYSLSSVEAFDFLEEIVSLIKNIQVQYLFLVASVTSLSAFPASQQLYGRFRLFIMPFFSIIVSLSLTLFTNLFMVFPREMISPFLPKVRFSIRFLLLLLHCSFAIAYL
jgi:hypothetical protein